MKKAESRSATGRSLLSTYAPGALIVAVTVGILWIFRAQELTGDSLAHLTAARDGISLFHPHHLVFNFSVRLVYLTLLSTVGVDNVLLAAQIHNLAFAALGLLAVYWLGAIWLQSTATGAIACLGAGSSAILLVFATQPEVYIPSAALLFVATGGAVSVFEKFSPKLVFFCAASWALAMCFHQVAVVFLAALVALALSRCPRQRLPVLAVITLLAGLSIIVAYLLAYQFCVNKTWYGDGFVDFVFYYLRYGDPTWGEVRNIGASGLGNLLRSHLWGFSSVLSGVRVAGLAVVGVMISGLVGVVLMGGRARHRELAIMSAGWIFGFGAFFLWWFPEEIEFGIFADQGVLLLFTAAIGTSLITAPKLTGLRVAVLTVVPIGLIANLGFNIFLEARPRHVSKGMSAEIATELHAVSPSPCLILARHQIVNSLRFYYPERSHDILEVTLLERQMVNGQPLSAHLVEKVSGDCITMLVSDIQPGANFSGRNGIRNPREWTMFLNKLLAVSRREDGVIRARTMVAGGTEGNGIRWVRVERRLKVFDSPEAVFEMVASAARNTSYETAFRVWFQQHGGMLGDLLIHPERTEPRTIEALVESE